MNVDRLSGNPCFFDTAGRPLSGENNLGTKLLHEFNELHLRP
jgi:hypothetical protein